MKKSVSALMLLLMLSPAVAQEMPAPHRSPREPVSREVLMEPRDPMPASHQVQGPAAIIDGEKLRIGESDLRLFGIVPPQLAASFGPQARAALDQLAGGQAVTCQIRDRDRDGRLLATCRNAGGSDMAMELLRRGLAVTARGSIAGTEFASPYIAAEQAAQAQHIGLWSVSTTAAATPAVVAPPAPVVTPAPAPKQESAALPAEADTKDDRKDIAPRSDKAGTETQIQTKIAAELTAAQQAQTKLDDQAYGDNDNTGFFERYQILIACFLMLATALSIITALWAQKRRDRTDELKAIAAALRGELMAARSVCYGRAHEITGEAEDRASSWPRIRTTLYQAYVGRLGLLGAELARHIASIYGQSSDYAALHNPASGAASDLPKKQALEALARRIDDVLPTLTVIERDGIIPAMPVPQVRMTSIAPQPRGTLINNTTLSQAMRPTPRAVSAPQPPVDEKSAEPKPSETVDVDMPVTETSSVDIPMTQAPLPSQQAHSPSISPVALWENVRGFLQNHRNAVRASDSVVPEVPTDSHVSDYAAMIEADMASYQYSDRLESFDVTPPKTKRG